MKKIIMSLSLFFSLVGYSQIAVGRYAGSDGVPLNLQFHDANGNLIPIGEHKDINGSPKRQVRLITGCYIHKQFKKSFVDNIKNIKLWEV